MSEGDDTGSSPQSGEQKTEEKKTGDKKIEENSLSVQEKKAALEVRTENGHGEGDVKENEINENNVESPKPEVENTPQEEKEVKKDSEKEPVKTEEDEVTENRDETMESEGSSKDVSMEDCAVDDEKEAEQDQSKSEKSEVDGEAETTPKPKRKKKKRGPTYYYEEVNEGDEEALGSVERTPIVESGKRERKKVERLSMSSTFTPPEKKPLEIPEGKGDKLGDSQAIEVELNRHRSSDLKALHRILFGVSGVATQAKRNIRQFSGFDFDKNDKEYQKKMDLMNKFFTPVLKDICKVLSIERSGTKDAIVQRIMDFLMCPHISGKPVTSRSSKPRKKRATRKEMEERRKKAAEDGKTKKSKKSVSSEDEKSEEEQSESEKEEEEEEEEEEQEEEEPEPPKKKKKTEKSTPKKAEKKEEKSAKKPKPNQKEEKKEVKKEAKKETKKDTKKERPQKKEKAEKKKHAADDESSEEDEPLAKKKKEAPGNDELKDLIKKILDGADLEQVTMKTVVKQVYAKYPDFDLTDRKEFIKSTVKQIIS